MVLSHHIILKTAQRYAFFVDWQTKYLLIMHKMYNKVHYVKIISLPTEMAGRLIIQDSLLAYLLVDEYFMTLAVCVHDDV